MKPSAGNDARPAADPDERKAHVLTKHSASIVRSISDAVVIKAGEPFFLCPPDGQIDTQGGHGFGLYQHDTRFLAGYEMTVAGARPDPLAATAVTGSKAILELTMPEIALANGRTIAKERLAIRWERQLDGDQARLVDEIRFRSYDREAARLPIQFSFAAGFEDVFEVRGLLAERPGTLHDPRWDDGQLVFVYDGQDGVTRTLTVAFDPGPLAMDAHSCELGIDLDGHGRAAICLTLQIAEDVHPGASPIERRGRNDADRSGAHELDSRTHETSWSGGNAWPVSVVSDSIALNAALARSLDDLLMLRDEIDGQRYYAAGVPWFSTLFGRDSLITAYQSLAFDPTVAAHTLRLLAGRQGSRVDDWRDEQPGKILHELRIGELARLHEIPHTPYYGSIDSTLLFLVVLARHASWTGSLDLLRELRANVERALEWIDHDGVLDGRGYVAYDSTTKHGLVNQGWKDSGDGIVNADGSMASPPIALAEVQGYADAAKLEIAELFERDCDAERAQRLRGEAAELQHRFEDDFWSEDLGCYVLALGADGRPCDVASSNAGQVLWSGIARQDRAAATAQRLLAGDMFNGWGIRTLSAESIAFNPIGYHLGTVWPHDNAMIAEGFRRYGLDDAADRVFAALIEATTDFPQQQLPECFAGHDREEFGVPVRYPIACHPQAWAAGAIPQLLTATLGLMPSAFDHRLRVTRPMLPSFVDHLELYGLRVGSGRADLVFEQVDGRTSVRVAKVVGDLEVMVEPA